MPEHEWKNDFLLIIFLFVQKNKNNNSLFTQSTSYKSIPTAKMCSITYF